MSNETNKGEIIIFEAVEGQAEIEVKLQDETIWLTQKQIADVFGKNIPTVNEHIKHIFQENELDERSTIRKFRIVQTEGKRQITRDIDHYNLDMVLSVGYRVSSKKATQFRIWATKTLKNYLLKGYSINQKVLLGHQEKLKELQEIVSFINDKKKLTQLSGQAEELIEIINSYTHSLQLLAKYDVGKLKLKSAKKPEYILNYEDGRNFINKIADRLSQDTQTAMFGQERSDQFKAILGALYQTFGGKDLYASVEEKAANLLYLTIKDHPFSDGNKRIGSLLFIYFLERNNYLWDANGQKKINDHALTALALLIAVSDPKEKDVMINLVTNLL